MLCRYFFVFVVVVVFFCFIFLNTNCFLFTFLPRLKIALSCLLELSMIMSSWTFFFSTKRRIICGMVEHKQEQEKSSSKIKVITYFVIGEI